LLKRNFLQGGDVWEVIGQLKEELNQEKRAREKLEEEVAAMQASMARLLTYYTPPSPVAADLLTRSFSITEATREKAPNEAIPAPGILPLPLVYLLLPTVFPLCSSGRSSSGIRRYAMSRPPPPSQLPKASLEEP
jgi:hypothetical protein